MKKIQQQRRNLSSGAENRLPNAVTPHSTNGTAIALTSGILTLVSRRVTQLGYTEGTTTHRFLTGAMAYTLASLSKEDPLFKKKSPVMSITKALRNNRMPIARALAAFEADFEKLLNQHQP